MLHSRYKRQEGGLYADCSQDSSCFQPFGFSLVVEDGLFMLFSYISIVSQSNLIV
jgi:hypothetical protein